MKTRRHEHGNHRPSPSPPRFPRDTSTCKVETHFDARAPRKAGQRKARVPILSCTAGWRLPHRPSAQIVVCGTNGRAGHHITTGEGKKERNVGENEQPTPKLRDARSGLDVHRKASPRVVIPCPPSYSECKCPYVPTCRPWPYLTSRWEHCLRPFLDPTASSEQPKTAGGRQLAAYRA